MHRAALFALILAGACAHPKPVLYPDEKLKAAGKEQSEKDVAECRALAKTHVKQNWKKPVARRTGFGAFTGAVMGMAVGLVTGDFGRAAASGAAAGGAVGLVHGVHEASGPDAVERAFTDRCLQEKGYSVLGWR